MPGAVKAPTITPQRGSREGESPPFFFLEHDPEKLFLDLIGDGHRFSEKIMLRQNVVLCLR